MWLTVYRRHATRLSGGSKTGLVRKPQEARGLVLETLG